MSPTPDTEREQLKYGIAFLVKYGEEGVFIDTAIDVSRILGMGYVGMLAAEKLTGKEDSEARSLASAISLMTLRARVDMSTYGPYLVKSESPMYVEELEKALRAMDSDHRIQFLKKARL